MYSAQQPIEEDDLEADQPTEPDNRSQSEADRVGVAVAWGGGAADCCCVL